jgi:hypothetical protein
MAYPYLFLPNSQPYLTTMIASDSLCNYEQARGTYLNYSRYELEV